MYKPYDRTLDTIVYIVSVLSLIFLITLTYLIKCTGFNLSAYMSPCKLYIFTGFYCPGCGGTRSFLYLIHGRFIKSFIYHPIVLFAFIPGLWFILTQTLYRLHIPLKGIFKKLLHPLTVTPLYIYSAIIILLAQWIIKNVLIFFNIRII